MDISDENMLESKIYTFFNEIGMSSNIGRTALVKVILSLYQQSKKPITYQQITSAYIDEWVSLSYKERSFRKIFSEINHSAGKPCFIITSRLKDPHQIPVLLCITNSIDVDLSISKLKVV